jgi:hypothetical protein
MPIRSIVANLANAVRILPVVLGLVWLALGSILTVAGSSLSGDSLGFKPAYQFIPFIVSQFPAVPFPIGELLNQDTTVIGIFIAIMGIDILLVGLGLWARHKLARWIAIAIFGLAAYFDFTQFLLLGFLGAPCSTIEAIVNSLIAYVLFKRDIWFDK